MKKINLGDVIVYYGGLSEECGRIQEVIDIIDKRIYTVFKDTGETNSFIFDSGYFSACNLFRGGIKNDVPVYGNGIPMMWGDEI